MNSSAGIILELSFAALMAVLSFRIAIAAKKDSQVTFARTMLSFVVAIYAASFALPYIFTELIKSDFWIQVLRLLCLFSLFVYGSILRQNGEDVISKD